MARNKSVIKSSASVDLIYQSADEMPWSKIESVVGKEFHSYERQEILGCFEAYCAGFEMVEQAVTQLELQELHDKLVSYAKAICDLAERHRPDGEVAATLSRAYSNYDNELHIHYLTLSDTAAEILTCFEGGQSEDFQIDPSSQSAHTEGLRDFCDKAIRGATAVPARSSHANDVNARDGFEYERWGIAIGPRCNSFPEFVSAVLGKQVTSDQLRNSWPHPKCEQDD